MRERSTRAAPNDGWRQVRTLCAMFALGVVTQRFAIPFGATQLPIAFPIYCFTAFWLAAEGLVAPLRVTSVVICIALSCLLLSSLLSVGKPSLASLFYLLALYVPLTMGSTKRIGEQQARNAGRFFVNMMVCFGVLALWQFCSQQFLHLRYIDPLERLPQAVVMQGYLTSYPVSYGADLYKSNAYVFLEASILSQFIALAIVVELSLFRRVMPILVLFAALVTTFSGTGVILLAAACPVLVAVNARDIRTVLLTLVAILALLGALVSRPEVLARVTEFGQRDTSATARFIEPYMVLARDSLHSASAFFAGYGAGAADRMVSSTDALVNFAAIPKAIIEYGFIGGVPLLLAIAFRLLTAGHPAPILVALLVMHYFLSGALLQPISVMLLFFFVMSGSRRSHRSRTMFAVPSHPVGSRL